MLSEAVIQLLKRRMNSWNAKRPVDLMWRQHFKIPFGSREHQEADVFDQQVWYEESQLLKELQDKFNKEEDFREDKELYDEITSFQKHGVKNKSKGNNIDAKLSKLPVDTVSELPMSQEEIDKEFENMDLSVYNQKPEEPKKED